MMVDRLTQLGWRIDAEDAEDQWWSALVRRVA